MTDTTHTGLRARPTNTTLAARIADRFGAAGMPRPSVDLLADALDHVLPTPPAPQETAPEVEAVGWQWQRVSGGWDNCPHDLVPMYQSFGRNVRPLYASPPPSAAPTDNTALVEALKQSLWLAVATLAFHGRDRGTNRQEKMLDDLEELARKVDPLVRAAQTSLGMDHVGKPLAALASRPAAPRPEGDVGALAEAWDAGRSAADIHPKECPICHGGEEFNTGMQAGGGHDIFEDCDCGQPPVNPYRAALRPPVTRG